MKKIYIEYTYIEIWLKGRGAGVDDASYPAMGVHFGDLYINSIIESDFEKTRVIFFYKSIASLHVRV